MPRRLAARIALLASCFTVYAASSAHANDYPFAFEDRPLKLMDIRLTLGKVTERSHYADTGLIVEPAIVARFGLEGRPGDWNLTLLPEIGGSFWSTEATRGALFTAGLGLGWTRGPWLIGMVPSVVTGTYERGAFEADAHGFRVTTMVELMQIAGVQASYQRLEIDGHMAHQAMVSGSLNLIPLYILARICGGH